uniref:Uncharacterized protein n=1 Tax=Brassica campestris TaxID=3711 RepID=A0A3P6D5D7_BRACM|nr:unnamed protein product [Brassica rapa]
MSAHKARRVIDQIRGRSFLRRSTYDIRTYAVSRMLSHFFLVYSAAANASHNKGFKETNLVISKAEVNQGNTVKKKIKNSGTRTELPNKKRSTCHITIVLEDISLYQQYEEYLMYLKKKNWMQQ